MPYELNVERHLLQSIEMHHRLPWACCEKRQLSRDVHYTRIFNGRRSVERQRRRRIEGIMEWTSMKISEAVWIMEDGCQWLIANPLGGGIR